MLLVCILLAWCTLNATLVAAAPLTFSFDTDSEEEISLDNLEVETLADFLPPQSSSSSSSLASLQDEEMDDFTLSYPKGAGMTIFRNPGNLSVWNLLNPQGQAAITIDKDRDPNRGIWIAVSALTQKCLVTYSSSNGDKAKVRHHTYEVTAQSSSSLKFLLGRGRNGAVIVCLEDTIWKADMEDVGRAALRFDKEHFLVTCLERGLSCAYVAVRDASVPPLPMPPKPEPVTDLSFLMDAATLESGDESSSSKAQFSTAGRRKRANAIKRHPTRQMNRAESLPNITIPSNELTSTETDKGRNRKMEKELSANSLFDEHVRQLSYIASIKASNSPWRFKFVFPPEFNTPIFQATESLASPGLNIYLDHDTLIPKGKVFRGVITNGEGELKDIFTEEAALGPLIRVRPGDYCIVQSGYPTGHEVLPIEIAAAKVLYADLAAFVKSKGQELPTQRRGMVVFKIVDPQE